MLRIRIDDFTIRQDLAWSTRLRSAHRPKRPSRTWDQSNRVAISRNSGRSCTLAARLLFLVFETFC